jgi:hypothetical protein
MCGVANGPCCANNTCNGGLTCDDGECTACGGPGQPCCPNRACSAGGCCVGAGTDAECVAANAVCPLQGPGNAGMCTNGRCGGCGAAGQRCCDGQLCYDAGNACVSGMCQACGGAMQPACPGNSCSAGHCLNDDAVCVPVGAQCGGSAGTCTANGSCMMGNTTCGGLNQICCEIGQTNTPRFCAQSGTRCNGFGANARCVACGEMGQPCCEDSSCKTGTCGGFPQTCR